jgi:hypothetical protein
LLEILNSRIHNYETLYREKSDIYAFGVIVLQVLSGKSAISCSIRTAFESLKFDDCIDTNLMGRDILSLKQTHLQSLQCSVSMRARPDERPNRVM